MTDITMAKAAAGFALGKMLGFPIWFTLLGAGLPWLYDPIMHRIAVAFDEIATILHM